MKPAPIVLKTFFTTFNTDVVVSAIATVSAGVYKITYDCKTFVYAYLTGDLASFRVIHSGTTHYYTVTAIGTTDFTITVSGVDYTPVLADTFRLPLPTFIHGTQKKCKSELDSMVQAGNVSYPIVYLQEIQTEKFTNDPDSAIYSKTPVRLWFILPNDKNYTTDNHYDYIINAMQQLAHRVMYYLHYSNVTADIDDDRDQYDLIYHANIGTTSETGHLKDLFTEPHSGVLLNSILSLSQESCC